MSTKQHPMVGLLDAGYVQKDKKNSFHKYSYASDEGVTKKFRDVMKNNDLFIKSCEVRRLDVNEVTNARGEKLQHAIILLGFVLSDKSGNEYGPYEGCGSAMDKGDKAVMKAMTAARKYAISQAALISWGDDDPEGDPTVDETMHAKPDAKPTPPKSNGAPQLSDAAQKVLNAATKAAPGGMEAVTHIWKMASDKVKGELKDHPSWKKIGEMVKKPVPAGY